MKLFFDTRAGFALMLLLSVNLCGCSRSFFRKATDREVECILKQKNQYPGWQIENWHLYPDPRARFADPSDPDCPPRPIDDPASAALSPNPQPRSPNGNGSHEGRQYLQLIASWDAQNRAEAAAEKARKEAEKKRQEQKTPTPKKEKDSELLHPPRPRNDIEIKQASHHSREEATDPLPPAANTTGPILGEPPLHKMNNNSPTALGEGDKEDPDEAKSTETTTASYVKALKSNEQPMRLKLEQCVELGLFNSREFQDRREDLYLAALPVSFERFAFVPQLFAASTSIFESSGKERPEGGGERWRINSDAGLSKRFTTGALLLFRFANQTVIELGSGNSDRSVSTLTASITQPLLRGGGFAVNMEDLTQSERNLLYGIRSYARFRKLYYVVIAGNGDYTNNPYGLTGLSQNLGRGIGANLTAPNTGYLPTLLRDAILENERQNVAALERNLELFRALKEGGSISDLQVGQVELQLLRGRSTVLQREQELRDALDTFKLQLGVPTNLPLELDDESLLPIRKQLSRYEDAFAQVKKLETTARDFDLKESPAQLRTRLRELATNSEFVQGTQFAEKIGDRIQVVEKLSDEQLRAYRKKLIDIRRELLEQRTQLEVQRKPIPEELLAKNQEAGLQLDLCDLESLLREFAAQPWKLKLSDPNHRPQDVLFRDVINAFQKVMIEASTERLAKIRAEWPKLPPLIVNGHNLLEADFDQSLTSVAQTALTNRLDLMNARGQLLDSWRKIAVAANDLQGVLDVSYDIESTTPGGKVNPFGFSGSRTRHRVSFNGELPLVRRLERNNYRATLISFQRQRRSLISFEDNIVNDVRADMRRLRVLAENFKLQQRAVELAYLQVDNALEVIQAPPDPRQQGADSASGAAALTNQYLQAQNSLLQAQSNLYTVWVNYLTARMQLYLDLELIPLDCRGVWIDEFSHPEFAPRPSGTIDNGHFPQRNPSDRDAPHGIHPEWAAPQRDPAHGNEPKGSGTYRRPQPRPVESPSPERVDRQDYTIPASATRR